MPGSPMYYLRLGSNEGGDKHATDVDLLPLRHIALGLRQAAYKMVSTGGSPGGSHCTQLIMGNTRELGLGVALTAHTLVTLQGLIFTGRCYVSSPGRWRVLRAALLPDAARRSGLAFWPSDLDLPPHTRPRGLSVSSAVPSISTATACLRLVPSPPHRRPPGLRALAHRDRSYHRIHSVNQFHSRRSSAWRRRARSACHEGTPS
jgi:hypothetical protein